MMNILLFDLDGTLTDPALGITNSIRYALTKMGREIPDHASLLRFIGPPLVPAFCDLLGMTASDANLALTYYREYFSDRGKFENTPYDGIGEALATLQQSGYTLALATSKPEVFAVQILEHFDLAPYFTVICGATLDETRNKKSDVIRYALDMLHVSKGDRENRILMIGDRLHDVEGAGEHGIPTLGVLWGYGSKDELTQSGACHTVETVSDMVQFLLSENK